MFWVTQGINGLKLEIMEKDSQKTAKSFSKHVEEVVESFIASFLFVLLFAIYRAYRGIPLLTVRKEITAGYLKFVIVFVLIGLALYLLTFKVLRCRIWLDYLLGALSLACLIGFTAFGGNQPEIRMIAFLFSILLVHYLFNVRGLGIERDLSRRGAVIALVLIASLSVLLLTAIAVMRHRVFLTSGFDLGVFDQMFYHMAQGKPPTSTSEGFLMNNMLEVHFSPILFLLLPAYKVWPRPETLMILQCLFAAAAIIPLYKIARLFNLNRKTAAALGLIFLLQPGIFGGQTRDFHEVKLLPFFLLWFIYFFERNKERFDFPTVLFLILTLMVKEDAAVYLLAYGMSGLFRDPAIRKKSLILCLVSLVYFGIVSGLIVKTNTEFSYRYSKLLPGISDASLFDLLKVLFTSPFSILIRVADTAKINLYSLLLLPLALIPLKGFLSLKKVFLLIPFVVFNVLQDIEWQAIESQYFFGPVSFFLLLVIWELAESPSEKSRRTLLALMLVTSALFSLSVHLPKLDYFKSYQKNKNVYQELETILAAVPVEKSVSASNHFYSHLSHRDEIYPTALLYQTDIVAYDLRDEKLGVKPAEILERIVDEGYGVQAYEPDFYIMLEKGLESDLTGDVVDTMRYLDAHQPVN